MEERNNSHLSEDSLMESNAVNNPPPQQVENYVKKKFRRQLYIISIIFSSLLLATFLGVFIYYLQNKMLGGKDQVIPNHYIIKQVNFKQNSVSLHAEYEGEENPQYPNIYQNIVVDLSLESLPNQPSQKSSSSCLRIDIKQDLTTNKQQQNYNFKSAKFIKENQLQLEDVDLGPFDLQYSEQGSKLAFIISRNSTGEKIFDTLDYNILISEFYTTIGTYIPNGQFYGLGERRTNEFSFQEVYKGISQNCTYGFCNRYRFWNRNPKFVQELFDIGLGNGQLSGYQPLYLIQEETQNYSLIYIDNAFSGLEVDYYKSTANSQNAEALVFQNYNSHITFKIFLGDTDPETVIRQYHDYIGHFKLIPFWALGYHHSKVFNMPIAQNLKNFLDYITKLNLPIDGLWTNLEFNIDGNQFKIANDGLINQLKELKTNYKLKWIPQIPSEISKSGSSEKYIQHGIEQNTYILSNKTKLPYEGVGIFGKSLFIDYNHVNASELFSEALLDLYEQVGFDGLWLNQNEPSTQITGEFVNNEINKSNGYFDIIYNYTNFNFNEYLINIDALHYNQPNAPYFYNQKSGNYLYERDLHYANGFMQSATVFNILEEKMEQKQPFIISSSNKPGSGMYIAHSTGAYANDWSVLQTSFIEIFNFQLYGIPFTGGNICPITVLKENDIPSISELCTRWYQAASVYPFMHSTQIQADSDPFFLKDYSYLFNSVKESLSLRYSLLKHYYSLYVLKKGTGMVFKPISFVFPQVSNQDYFVINANNTAMIGDSLYVFTVMTPGDRTTNSTQVNLGIPPQLWVNLLNTHVQYKGPFSTKYNFPFSASPLIFLREGHLILWQKINQQESARASLLEYQFSIKGVLTITNQDNLDITYQTKGSTLGILNYNDSQALKKCGKQGCELNITVDVISKNNKDLDVAITFLAEDTQYFEEGIIINEVQISGVIKYNEMLLQYCQSNDITTQPFDIITVKQTLLPAQFLIVGQRQQTFRLSMSI